MAQEPTEDRQMQGTVLIVEDNFLIADDFRSMLEDNGWLVTGLAATAEQALGWLVTNHPSVALLDLQLRVGLTTPVAMELRRRTIPFVLSSGCVHPVEIGGPVFEGVVNVGKPVSAPVLHAALLEAVAVTG